MKDKLSVDEFEKKRLADIHEYLKLTSLVLEGKIAAFIHRPNAPILHWILNLGITFDFDFLDMDSEEATNCVFMRLQQYRIEIKEEIERFKRRRDKGGEIV